MHMLTRLSLPVALLLLGQSASAASPLGFKILSDAMALTPDPKHGEVLYLKHCTGCHSPRAWGKGPVEVPALAGQREFYLIGQLVQFSALERIAPEMHRVVVRPDLNRPQSIRDLAAYLARQARNPHADHGTGAALATGERVYVQSCALCHGKNGEGSESEPIPAIGGQHYYYLLAQLRGFAAGHRGNVEPPVIDVAAGLSPEEMQAVADYASRLTALRSE